MDIDHEEPTIYQSDTKSYRGMCRAEFKRLMKEVEDGDEGRSTREDVNEGNSRPTYINFNEEEIEEEIEEGIGENEEEIEEGEKTGIEEGDEEGIEEGEEEGTGEGEETEANIIEGDESLKGPRRGKIISERGLAKSYATPAKRSKKTATKESKGACSNTMEGEKELRRALEDEFLEATPLNESQAEQTDYYCVIRQVEEGVIGVG